MEGIIVGDIIEAKGLFLKFHNNTVHCKKNWRFSRESLVSDIPAGDGKTASLFLQCKVFSQRDYSREKGKYFVRKTCDGWKGGEGQAGTVVT